MYDNLFCRVYNEFGWNEYPRVFGEALIQWLAIHGADVHTALDLGCGTGVLCETLSAQGIDTLGVDLSEDMIGIAKSRAPGLQYRVGNMVTLETERRFDLVTCTGDALNHVTDIEDIRRVFANVHRALNPGGFFVFDLLKADEVPMGEPFEAPLTDHLTVRFRATRDSEDFTTLMIDGYEDGALKFSERIREKIYDIDVICDLLRAAGFEIVQCADRLIPDSAEHGTTWFVIAKKDTIQHKELM